MRIRSVASWSREAVCVALVVWLCGSFQVLVAGANKWDLTGSPGNGLRIVDASDVTKTTPVVNEGGKLQLKVVDGSGNPVAVQSWSTDNKSVGKVNKKKGRLTGKAFGFATITAHTGQGDVSGFIVVARVRRQTGAMSQGDTKTDTGGNVYLSSPTRHVLYKASGLSAEVFAGHIDQGGYQDGTGDGIRFNGPAGIGVDNRAEGGLYIADTMNDCIRKVDFRERSSLAAGVPGFAGTMHGDENPIEDAVFDTPRGVASVGSNLYVTDTNNDCIWYVDVQRQVVELVAGEPGEPGNANGQGRQARFDHPSGITINSRQNLLAVADTGNNIVRLIAIAPRPGINGGVIGDVTTLGLASSSRNADILAKLDTDRGTDQITFDAPISVSFDGVDNVYVIDNQTASVVTRPSAASGRSVERVDLAQVGTLGDPASVTVRRTQAFVLNETPTSEQDALSVVEVGAPTITSVTPDTARLEGGQEVMITGTNFAPESKLTLGDAEVTNYTIERSTRITFTVPALQAPGGRTLTVLTRGGVAQLRFNIVAKPYSELEPGEITTIYGGIPYLGDGGPALTAHVEVPYSVSYDGAGNLYVVNSEQYRIRRIDASTGLITTVAGTGIAGFSGDGGLATAATIGSVSYIAVDPSGNLYISDSDNNRVRRVDATTGIISTVAGSDDYGSGGDGGPVSQAQFYNLSAITFDAMGNLYIVDNSRIRRVDAATDIIHTVAGQDGQTGDTGDGGPAVEATLDAVLGLTVDTSGNIYLVDYSNSNGVARNRIRRIDAVTGTINTYAGTGSLGYTGDGGPAVAATLNNCLGLACDAAGNLFIADYSNLVIRRVDSVTGIIETVAGNGEIAPEDDGIAARESAVVYPYGVAVNGAGTLVIACADDLIRFVDRDSQKIYTTAGRFADELGDGKPFSSASLYLGGMAFDGQNNLYVSDQLHERVCRVDASTGVLITIAGTGTAGSGGDGGPASLASLYFPGSLAVASNGDLYIADRVNYKIRRIAAVDKTIAAVAGIGTSGDTGDGGPATAASFGFIQDIEIDDSSNLFLCDLTSNRIRRIEASSGTIATVAGNGTRGFSGDGMLATNAALRRPDGIDLDSEANLLVADTSNSRIRKVDAASGIIRTIVGNTPDGSLGDGGSASEASLIGPSDVAVDGAGNFFIFDGIASTGRKRVRRVDAVTGIITTTAGSDLVGYSGDGGPGRLATLGLVFHLEIDRIGNLYLMGSYAIRVIKGVAALRLSSSTLPTFSGGHQ